MGLGHLELELLDVGLNSLVKGLVPIGVWETLTCKAYSLFVVQLYVPKHTLHQM